MIYSEPLINQISRFITSIGFGFVICILYLMLVFIRMCLSEKKWAVIAQDIAFGIIATLLSFFFMVLYNNGEVRFNLVLGQAIGGGVLYFTLARYFLKFFEKGAKAIRKLISFILMPLKLYLKAFPKFFGNIIRKIKQRPKKQKGEKKQKEKKKRKKKDKKKKYSQNPLEKSE